MQFLKTLYEKTITRRNIEVPTIKNPSPISSNKKRKIIGIGNHYVAVSPPFLCQGETEYNENNIGIITNNQRIIKKEYQNNRIITSKIQNYNNYFIVSEENYCKCDLKNDKLEFSNNIWNESIELSSGNIATKKNNKIIFKPRLNGDFITFEKMLRILENLEKEINEKIKNNRQFKIYDDASSDEIKNMERKINQYKESEFNNFLSIQYPLIVYTTEQSYLYQLKMPYGGVDFLTYLDKNTSKINIKYILKLLINALEGIRELIDKRLIHQDIYGNILINNNKGKIIDFETLITFDELNNREKISVSVVEEMYKDVKKKRLLPNELTEFIKMNETIEDVEEMDQNILNLIIKHTKIKNTHIDTYFIGLLLKYVNKKYLKMERSSSSSLTLRRTVSAGAGSEDSSRELQKKYLEICKDLIDCRSNIYEIIKKIKNII
jgi:hypothetical protein